MLLLATLSVGIYYVIALTTINTIKDTDKANLLINNLRRTLMKDNVDYAEETNRTETDDNTKDAEDSQEESRKFNNFYIPELTKTGKKKNRIEHKVSNTDLLYYMDDQENDEDKKYKVLKLKHNYRRREQARLIQEESKEKVVIVNINKGPIPEMRLPKSRRQYMHDHGEVVVDDEEVPPPVVNTSDPEAAAEEDTATEMVKQ